jgi:hypothetical protein
MTNLMKQTLLYMVALSLLMAACGTENDILRNQELSTGARVKFIHAVVDGPGVNIFANTAKINGTALPYGGSFPTEYSALPAGQATLRVATVASGTVAEATVLQAPVTLENDKYYSVVATGVVSSTATPPRTLLLTDDLTVPDPTKNYVRVLNLLTSGQAIDLAIGTAAPVLTNVPANTASGYVAIEPNAATAPYLFQARLTGTTPQIGGNASIQTLNRGRKYTIVVRGVVGRTGAAAPALSQYTVR